MKLNSEKETEDIPGFSKAEMLAMGWDLSHLETGGQAAREQDDDEDDDIRMAGINTDVVDLSNPNAWGDNSTAEPEVIPGDERTDNDQESLDESKILSRWKTLSGI